MEYRLKAKMRQAAREDAWRRGCTCGSSIRVVLISEGPPRPMVGVEHAVPCPLYQPRELSREALKGVEPDALLEVERP